MSDRTVIRSARFITWKPELIPLLGYRPYHYLPSVNLVIKNSGSFALRMRACVFGMS